MKKPAKVAKIGTKAKTRDGANKPMRQVEIPGKPGKTKYATPTQKQRM